MRGPTNRWADRCNVIHFTEETASLLSYAYTSHAADKFKITFTGYLFRVPGASLGRASRRLGNAPFALPEITVIEGSSRGKNGVCDEGFRAVKSGRRVCGVTTVRPPSSVRRFRLYDPAYFHPQVHYHKDGFSKTSICNHECGFGFRRMGGRCAHEIRSPSTANRSCTSSLLNISQERLSKFWGI